jgi:hypothetical protein
VTPQELLLFLEIKEQIESFSLVPFITFFPPKWIINLILPYGYFGKLDYGDGLHLIGKERMKVFIKNNKYYKKLICTKKTIESIYFTCYFRN